MFILIPTIIVVNINIMIMMIINISIMHTPGVGKVSKSALSKEE